MTAVAIADDHKIFCDSLTALINDFPGFEVIWTATDGLQTINKLSGHLKPKILLLDINMPIKNGFEVADWVQQNLPDLDILALTMENDDSNVIQMIRLGIKGYLLKNIASEELEHALQCVVKFGCYYTPLVTGQIDKHISANRKNQTPELTERELELLRLMCTDLSYAQIAEEMHLSESTVDTYRARLFEKFAVKNRIGLLLKAHHLGLVKL